MYIDKFLDESISAGLYVMANKRVPDKLMATLKDLKDKAKDENCDAVYKSLEEYNKKYDDMLKATTKPKEKKTCTCGDKCTCKDKPKADNVTHPSHYTRGKIEVIDFIDDQKFNYNRGNVVKYISRAGYKDKAKELEDLRKAEFYLMREIAMLEGENK